MYKCFVLFVSLSIAILCRDVQSQSDSTCTRPNGDEGDCVNIKDCYVLYKVLKDANSSAEKAGPVKDSACGPQQEKHMVCCPRCFTPDEQLGKCVYADSCPSLRNLLSQNQSQAAFDYIQNSRCENWDEDTFCCGSLPRPPPNHRAKCVLSSALPDLRGPCCGRENEADDRILGGNATAVDQYPWMAFIQYRETNSTKSRCGGALVSGKYVLTAAHCVLGTEREPVYPEKVRLGDYDIANEGIDCKEDKCGDNPVVVDIQRTIPHPEFNPRTRLPKNDIALIRLTETVQYTGFIRPVCLPSSDVLVNPSQKVYLVAVGWGLNSTDAKKPSNIKLHVELPYVSLEICQGKYQVSYTKLPLWKKQLCAGGEEGKDTCQGDSGGPLLYKKKTNPVVPVFEVVGIISTGVSCGVKGVPGVYTKVFEYVPWIRSQIAP